MRQAGVLIPLFSIRAPGSWGLGEIPDLTAFARWASSAGFSVVQLLPVTEASRGQSSPYGALSAFAVDPVYLSLAQVEDFAAAGGEAALSDADRDELAALRAAPSVQWERIRAVKGRALELAFRAFLENEWKGRSQRAVTMSHWAKEHAFWLDEYALFVTLHDDVFGGRPWTEWPEALRHREPEALARARGELSERILFRSYLQWQLDLQWHAARDAAAREGVELMGDLPFMVATDSADVWSRPFDFRLDARVGVPPDAFSDTGQDWGLPVYRWDVMDQNGFAWMNERARRGADQYGLYRVDHVVGLYRTYYRPLDGGPPAFIPADEPAQIANGERVMAILSQGARVIAEDLGTVPDFVRDSLTRCGIPGYRILRWERHWEQPGQPFRDPATWPALSVATTGTHDTESAAEWFDAMPDEERRALLELPQLAAVKARGGRRWDDLTRDAVLDLVYRSGSDLTLLPFQDALGHRERVNVPGTVNDRNWSYRMACDLPGLLADRATAERLKGLAVAGGRATV
ncbi:4-alpha-glucanotransferase [Anaeromyxobacter paludicola]|uniref:4-alpha-glucanotransferase n=1 Tax=Anaeromyxobacter paludicola TaxID=2918171 RepID=A0ABM7XC49_9BACT|nr:4-alpha-glucanotransferase [Anaeromyxobacter paludicola]BDG09437.1 4-alpha-glucanotransferase [Anaeromyxobacter paludicola]